MTETPAMREALPDEPDDVPDLYDDECWKCGGSGSLTDTCTCGDDTCCCLEPEEEICDICNGKG